MGADSTNSKNSNDADKKDSGETEMPPMDLRPTTAAFLKKGPIGVASFFIRLFSTVGERESPDPVTKTKHIRLITIAISHYCEKVRWALDMLEVDKKSPIYYTEDGHPPAFVAIETVKASNDTASATPMVVFNEANGETKFMYKSEAILQEFCPFLYPPEIKEEILRVEDDLGKRLGAALRCLVYYHALDPPYVKLTMEYMTKHVSKAERFFVEAMMGKGLSDGIRKALEINPATAKASENALRDVYKEYSERLENNGGEYLMDTPTKKYGFTAADIALAALSYPFVGPPCTRGSLLPEQDDGYPPEIREMMQFARSTRAGQHALRMYEKHRPVNPATGKVELKTSTRDRFPYKEVLSVLGVFGVAAAAAAAGVAISNGKK